jgi:hypothetical protein
MDAVILRACKQLVQEYKILIILSSFSKKTLVLPSMQNILNYAITFDLKLETGLCHCCILQYFAAILNWP